MVHESGANPNPESQHISASKAAIHLIRQQYPATALLKRHCPEKTVPRMNRIKNLLDKNRLSPKLCRSCIMIKCIS